MNLSIKAALAGAILLATIGSSFAATIDGNTKVLDTPNKWANTLQWAFDGQHVKVLQCQGKFCYVKLAGPDGWVRKSDIDFNNYNGPVYPIYPTYPSSPVHACFTGPYGYVCIN